MADRMRQMRAFVAVCDTKSFAAAARRLGVAPSAVTRLVGSLETDLGVVLLRRTTRAVSLTDAGARFLERCRLILADMDEAELAAQQERGTPRGLLTVSAPLLFGRMHLAPVVSTLLQRFPDLKVDLELSDRVVNLVEEGFDVAVRIGRLADSALIARRIGSTRRILIASPDYLLGRTPPKEPEDLSGHTLIVFHAGATEGEWHFKHPSRGTIAVPVNARFSTNNADAAIDHAKCGGGIASVFRYQVSAALADRQLVEILPEFASDEIPIHAVFPTKRLLSNKVRGFLDVVEEHAPLWRDSAR